MTYRGIEVIIIRESESVFGDGCHESTQMVLEALHQQETHGKSVLDIGTGTGIQSIFAKKLGASDVLAVDVDNVAITTAKKNFIKNNVDIKTLHNIYNESINKKFDITIANLPAINTIEFIPMAKKTMSDDGILIFSWFNDFSIREACLDKNGYKIVDHLEGIDWDSYIVKLK